MEALIGNIIERLVLDKGYRDHNAPPDYRFRVFISGQKPNGVVALGVKGLWLVRREPNGQTSGETWLSDGWQASEIIIPAGLTNRLRDAQ